MTAVEPIAIVGMAARFPGSRDVDEFRDKIFAGVDCTTELTDEELLALGEPPDVLADPTYVRRRPVIDGADTFDAGFFGMTPREAALRDPQFRLFLETSHAALAHAGYDPFTYDGDVGVYTGANYNWYFEKHVNNRPDVLRSAGQLNASISNISDYLATFVSYKLNLRGPSLTVLTACSSSLVAVHLACDAIRNGECEMAIAGGVQLTFPFRRGYLYVPGSIDADDGVVRAFDEHATGTNFGDGVGAVTLKKLTSAVAEGDTVYAVIRGSAINNDGSQKAGYSAPSASGQSECIRRALRTAGTDPASISYVEAHGTGTVVGDPIEMAGLIEAYRATAATELPDQYCAIGSVKSNIGHLGQAAGVAGLIKVALALHHRTIPASINVSSPNPAVDWESSPFRVVTANSEWATAEGQPRRAGISSFGVGGTNAHAILEEAPTTRHRSPAPRRAEALLWSAVDDATAGRVRTSLADYFTQLPAEDFPHAAHTLRVGRTPKQVRAALLAAHPADAATRLRDGGGLITGDGAHRSIVLAFPGQGAQRVGMLHELYEAEPLFRAGCDAAFDVLDPLLDLDLRREWSHDEAARINETIVAQPLLYTVEYTLAQCLIRWGLRPRALFGHSLGELVAAAVAGVFDFETGLRAVATRALAMAAMPRGAMLGVAATASEVADLATGELAIAAVNAARQVVLSGPPDAVEHARRVLDERGMRTRVLTTSHAFHSPAMRPAASTWLAAFESMKLTAPSILVVSSATGEVISDEQAVSPRFWADQLVQPVQFVRAADRVLTEERTMIIEAGPGRTLTGLLRSRPEVRSGPARVLSSTERAGTDSEITTLETTLAHAWVEGQPVTYWHELGIRGYRRIPAPGYPYDRRRHWIERPAPGPDVPSEPAAPDQEESDPVAEDSWHASEVVWSRDDTDIPLTTPPGSRRTAVLLHAGKSGGRVRLALARAGYLVRGIDTTAPGFDVSDDTRWQSALDDITTDGAPDLVVHAVLLDAPPSVSADDLDSQLTNAVHGFFAVLRALARLRRRHRRELKVVVIGRHFVDVTGGEVVNPAAAGVPALLRSVAEEQPGLQIRCLDVVDSSTVQAIAGELVRAEPLAALRGDVRWLPGRRDVPIARRSVPARLRHRGTYLVTGGLGGIGLVVAKAMAESGSCPRLVLLGRSGLPPADTAQGQSVRREIAAVEEAGAEVAVIAGDVSDERSLASAVAAAEARFGPVNGVVHSAGVPGGGLAERRARHDIERVLAPKVRGVRNLDAVFAARPALDFLVVFSSQAAVDGLYGSADYAYANAYMDAHVRASADGERASFSVLWPGWAEVGMLARSEAGLELLTGHRTGSDDIDASTVLERDYAPGASWELDEHVFAGTRVLPGSAVVELVLLSAQASGIAPVGSPVELSEVMLLTPVIADRPVHVRAVVTQQDDAHRVRVQSRERPDGGWTDHATAVVRQTGHETGMDLDQLWARLPSLPWAGLPRFIEFGERWNCMYRHHGDDDERVVRLVLAEQFQQDVGSHPLHPALFDVACGLLADLAPDRRHAPFLYRSVRCHAPLSADVTVHMRFGAGPHGGPRATDFDFYDSASGALLARVEGFSLREVPEEGLVVSPSEPQLGLLRPADGAEVFLSLLATDRVPPAMLIDPPGTHSVRQAETLPSRNNQAPATVPPAAVSPASETEPVPVDEVVETLRELWRRALGIADIGENDDFFTLGGNSLTAVAISQEIKAHFGRQLGAGAMFEFTTIKSMADELRR